MFADELKFAMRRRRGMTVALWTNRRIPVFGRGEVGLATSGDHRPKFTYLRARSVAPRVAILCCG